MNKQGFTLIELLVTIMIIAILAAILFPVFGTAREKGRMARCQSNLKQLGMAISMYVQDWEGYPLYDIGDSRGWLYYIYSYIATGRERLLPATRGVVKQVIFYCATDDTPLAYAGVVKSSYAINGGNTHTASWGDGIVGVDGTGNRIAATPEQIPMPADTILLTECWNKYAQFGSTQYSCIIKATVTSSPVGYHDGFGSRNYLFCDGHVKLLRPADTINPRDLWIKTKNY